MFVDQGDIPYALKTLSSQPKSNIKYLMFSLPTTEYYNGYNKKTFGKNNNELLAVGDEIWDVPEQLNESSFIFCIQLVNKDKIKNGQVKLVTLLKQSPLYYFSPYSYLRLSFDYPEMCVYANSDFKINGVLPFFLTTEKKCFLEVEAKPDWQTAVVEFMPKTSDPALTMLLAGQDPAHVTGSFLFPTIDIQSIRINDRAVDAALVHPVSHDTPTAIHFSTVKNVPVKIEIRYRILQH